MSRVACSSKDYKRFTKINGGLFGNSNSFVTIGIKEWKYMSKRKRTVIILIIMGVILSFLLKAGCIAACDWVMEPPTDEGTYKLDEDVDTLVVMPFSYDSPAETKCMIVKNESLINIWKSSHRWTNQYAVCCDEYTTHKIYAYKNHNQIYKKPYASWNKGYNNLLFTFCQNALVVAANLSGEWMYRVGVPIGTDVSALTEELEEKEKWYVIDENAVGEDEAYIKLSYVTEADDGEESSYYRRYALGEFEPDNILIRAKEAADEIKIPYVYASVDGRRSIPDRNTRIFIRTMKMPLSRTLTKEEVAEYKEKINMLYPAGDVVFETNCLDGEKLCIVANKKLSEDERAELSEKYGMMFELDKDPEYK